MGTWRDIVIEVPVQPAASASSSAAPAKKLTALERLHCAQPRLRHGARLVVSSRSRLLELTRETACLNYFCVIHSARPGRKLFDVGSSRQRDRVMEHPTPHTRAVARGPIPSGMLSGPSMSRSQIRALEISVFCVSRESMVASLKT